jgi:hypothetical protein
VDGESAKRGWKHIECKKADGGRHEVGGAKELYLKCPKSQLVWALDVRLIVRFKRFVVQK